jgi:hypothetical protein
MMAVNEKLYIDGKQILTQIGYGDDYRPSARISSLVNDYIDNYHDLIAPSYSYGIRDIISVDGERVTIEDGITFESKVISGLLERCEKVAVFALTIGHYLEEMVSYLAENGLVLQATVLDAVGSGAAEKMADFVQDRIAGIAESEGFGISRRFSPGYCDWEVVQQKKVFQALRGDSPGVTLTERCLMVPQKSISGIVGIGSVAEIADYNPCRDCEKQSCPGRR